MTATLIESVQRRLEDAGVGVGSVDVRVDPGAGYDVAVFLRAPGTARQITEVLGGDCHDVRARGHRVTMSVSADWYARADQALVATLTDDRLDGTRCIVDLADPNATKALHVGHLRNLALGRAAVGLHQARGAAVSTQSVVCDMGRSVGEAIAGFVMFRAADTPGSLGLKGDELVGLCYAEYVYHAGSQEPRSRGPDAPIERELEDRDDLAQQVLVRWTAGDPEIRAVWAKLRGWVLAGHEETLQRLGIRIDRYLLESMTVSEAAALARRGLERGVFQRWGDGTIVFDTGRSEYRLVPLVRKDGFPTEHLRALVLWSELAVELAEVDTIVHVMGDEWLLATEQRQTILARLGCDQFVPRYRKLVYGMVEHDGSQMKSSTGDVILIDRYLDRILQEPAFVARFADADAEARQRLAVIVGLAYFHAIAAAKPLLFEWSRVLSPEHNPGWWIARALGEPRPAPDGGDGDADTRFALLQAQRFRGLLARAQQELEPIVLLKYAEHLSRWFVQAPRSRRCAAVVTAVLDVTVRALGLDARPHD